MDFSSPEVQAQGKDLLNGVIRSYALLDEALLHAMQVRCFAGASLWGLCRRAAMLQCVLT